MEFQKIIDHHFAKKNWRVTAGTRNVIEILEGPETFYSTKDIQKKLKEKGRPIDLSTIYRILEKIKQFDLIHEFDGQFARCTDPGNPEEHHFLMCQKCHGAEEIFLDYKQGISDQLAKEKGFLLKEVHLAFKGECKHCH